MNIHRTWTHPTGLICHTQARSALLSKGVTRADLWGFAHLLVIIFVATNCREIMANILKYGGSREKKKTSWLRRIPFYYQFICRCTCALVSDQASN